MKYRNIETTYQQNIQDNMAKYIQCFSEISTIVELSTILLVCEQYFCEKDISLICNEYVIHNSIKRYDVVWIF